MGLLNPIYVRSRMRSQKKNEKLAIFVTLDPKISCF